MRESPILFSGPMVRAILSGTKTQTRRVVKHQPNIELHDGWKWEQTPSGWVPVRGSNRLLHNIGCCPYGHPGDRLWVRESAWLYGQWWKDGFTKSGRQRWTFAMSFGQKVRYERPLDHELTYQGSEYPGYAFRPSIHVPRWASRLTLEITGVRVERLQAISAEDAQAEGLVPWSKDGKLTKYGVADPDGLPGSDYEGTWPWHEWRISPVDAYQQLWNSINGEGAWDANPWVWVVEFRRAEVPHA